MITSTHCMGELRWFFTTANLPQGSLQRTALNFVIKSQTSQYLHGSCSKDRTLWHICMKYFYVEMLEDDSWGRGNKVYKYRSKMSANLCLCSVLSKTITEDRIQILEAPFPFKIQTTYLRELAIWMNYSLSTGEEGLWGWEVGGCLFSLGRLSDSEDPTAGMS